MKEKVNAGYIIEEEVSIKGNTYVLGHNTMAPAPYVTWVYVSQRDYYTYGHYFSNEADARCDMFKRAMEHLPNKEYDAIIRSAMSDELKAEIIEEGRTENHLSDIESCLIDALYHLDIDESRAAVIMADQNFIHHALHKYHNIDHSYENEALAESLETLLKESFPQYLTDEREQEATSISNLDSLISSAEGRKSAISQDSTHTIKESSDIAER